MRQIFSFLLLSLIIALSPKFLYSLKEKNIGVNSLILILLFVALNFLDLVIYICMHKMNKLLDFFN